MRKKDLLRKKFFKKNSHRERGSFKIKSVKNALVGLFTGIVNGIFGAGGGLILVPALSRISKLSQKKAQATSLAIILPISIISFVIYSFHSEINYAIAIPIIIGGLIGTPIGVYLLNKISSVVLQKIFAVFMIISAIKIIFYK